MGMCKIVPVVWVGFVNKQDWGEFH